MASSSSDDFVKMFHPEHPQRNLHIFVSILAFVVIVSSITLYLINKTKVSEQVVVPVIEDPNAINQAKVNKLTEMSQSLTVQEVTPQLKAKLAEMSKSLNKK